MANPQIDISTHPVTVLVTSAGTASAVNVIRALRLSPRPPRIVATDMDAWAAGLHLADQGYVSPLAGSDGFEAFLTDLAGKESVKAIIPIHSTEIAVVAGLASRLSALGVRSLLSPPSVVELCDDKRAMGAKAAALGVRVPQNVSSPQPPDFPLFVKPNRASGSRGTGIVKTQAELACLVAGVTDALVQRYVQGAEATVDCLVAGDRTILAVCPRWRLRVQGGQTQRGETFHDEALDADCRRLIHALGIVGPCNLQFIRTEAGWVFLEINPRWAAGGLMLTVLAGANLPSLALRSMLGESLTPVRTRPGIRFTRYMAETLHGAKEQA